MRPACRDATSGERNLEFTINGWWGQMVQRAGKVENTFPCQLHIHLGFARRFFLCGWATFMPWKGQKGHRLQWPSMYGSCQLTSHVWLFRVSWYFDVFCFASTQSALYYCILWVAALSSQLLWALAAPVDCDWHRATFGDDAVFTIHLSFVSSSCTLWF